MRGPSFDFLNDVIQENTMFIHSHNTRVPGHMLVTAGGTSVPWDDVHRLGNASKGGFGVEIANAAANRGVPVILLCTQFTKNSYWIHPKVVVVLYDMFDEYVARLKEIAEGYTVAYAISAAAVSDFGVEKVDGKVSSSAAPKMTLVPLPKVLATWRTLFGQACYIVGFKLHAYPTVNDGGTRRASTRVAWEQALDKLLAAADEQIKKCHLNLTCANFAPWKGNVDTARGHKRLWLRRPDGGGTELLGTNRDVATTLVDYILGQADVTWGKSVRCDDLRVDDAQRSFAGRVLTFAQRACLLTNTSGNITVMANGGDAGVAAWVTPRGVDKAGVTEHDLRFALIPQGQDTEIHYTGDGETKPSIDTRVYLLLGRFFPFLAAMHFHDGWVIDPDAGTNHDFPCGTNKAAGELIAAIARAKKPGKPLLVELTGHGHTLFLQDVRDLEGLEEAWSATVKAYEAHLTEVGARAMASELTLTPIWHGAAIVGLVARHTAQHWHSFFLMPAFRKGGLGAALVRLANDRKITIGAHDQCGVLDFYRDRGFEVIGRVEDAHLTLLRPPCLRDDLRRAATIRVVCPHTRTVFLGQRSASVSYPGLWCNLGGGIEKDPSTAVNDDLTTALDRDAWGEACREFREECGVDLSHLPPPTQHSVHYTCTVREDGREVVTEVTCFEVEVPSEFEASPQTEELEVTAWVPFGDLSRYQRGHATRETHRDLR